MNTHELTEAVFHALLDPAADFTRAARDLGITITRFLEIAESPQITAAIEALEKLARIRGRALLAQSSHLAIAALERIAQTDPETPAARETVRKAAAQLLRMAGQASEAAREREQSDDALPHPQAATPEGVRPEGAVALPGAPDSIGAGPRGMRQRSTPAHQGPQERNPAA